SAEFVHVEDQSNDYHGPGSGDAFGRADVRPLARAGPGSRRDTGRCHVARGRRSRGHAAIEGPDAGHGPTAGLSPAAHSRRTFRKPAIGPTSADHEGWRGTARDLAAADESRAAAAFQTDVFISVRDRNAAADAGHGPAQPQPGRAAAPDRA